MKIVIFEIKVSGLWYDRKCINLLDAGPAQVLGSHCVRPHNDWLMWDIFGYHIYLGLNRQHSIFHVLWWYFYL